MENTEIRQKIIDMIKNTLRNFDFVHACWLEGSDGLNKVDEYSDVDICVDADDDKVQEVFEIIERKLNDLSIIDFIHEVDCGNPKITQKYYHLENTSEYLIVDFAVQHHSRADEWGFIKNSSVEKPVILFDKSGVIRFKESDTFKLKEIIKYRLTELTKTISQKARVIKYSKRGQYIESFGYYHKYIVTPLVEILRLKYTPNYYYYYIVHISDHLPKDDVNKLRTFFETKTVEDIFNKTNEACIWFEEIKRELLKG